MSTVDCDDVDDSNPEDWVLCRAWDLAEEHDITMREAILRAWGEITDEEPDDGE